MTKELTAEKPKSLFTRLLIKYVVKPVKRQLTRGTSPKKVAFAMAISPVVATFPVMGTTNMVSVLAGWIFRLNIPFIILFKTIFYPLHLGLILVFVRIGEDMNGAPHIPFSIPQLLVKFKDDPIAFAKEFGITALYAIEAWIIIAPWFAIPLYFIFHFLIQKYTNRNSNEIS